MVRFGRTLVGIGFSLGCLGWVPLSAQSGERGSTECHGFGMGPWVTSTPEDPSARKPWEKQGEEQAWLFPHRCEFFGALLPSPEGLKGCSLGQRELVVIRRDGFEGDHFQLAIWRLPKGYIRCEVWLFPAWDALFEQVIALRRAHPDWTTAQTASQIRVHHFVKETKGGGQARSLSKALFRNWRHAYPSPGDSMYWAVKYPHRGPSLEVSVFTHQSPALEGLIQAMVGELQVKDRGEADRAP